MEAVSSLSSRGFKLASILDKPHGSLELILKVMDLENALGAANEELSAVRRKLEATVGEEEISDIIEVEEFAEGPNNDRLSSPPDEKVWIETLSNRTGLDIRAILHSDLPAFVGRFAFRVAYKKGGKMQTALLSAVWVVPVSE